MVHHPRYHGHNHHHPTILMHKQHANEAQSVPYNLHHIICTPPPTTDVASVSGTSSLVLTCEAEDFALMDSTNMACNVQAGKVRGLVTRKQARPTTTIEEEAGERKGVRRARVCAICLSLRGINSPFF